jgi:hypothetical protein
LGYVPSRPSDTTFCTRLGRVHFGVQSSAVMVVVEAYSEVAVEPGLGLRGYRRQAVNQQRHVAEDCGEVRPADLGRDFVVEQGEVGARSGESAWASLIQVLTTAGSAPWAKAALNWSRRCSESVRRRVMAIRLLSSAREP